MLSHIVKGILDEPDIQVVAELPINEAGVGEIARADSDVVIFDAAAATLQSSVRALLREQPRMKVLTVLRDGRDTSLYELRPHETALGQVSPKTLLAAVRTARTAPL
jgi:DNA-binding NarL/FixJ family response regulator